MGMRLATLVVIPSLAVAFIASGSRGPVLGLVVGLIVLLALAVRDPAARRRVSFILVGIVVASVLVVQLVPGQDIARSIGVILGNQQGLSSNGRYALWNEAWQVIGRHPLFGIGTGSFARLEPIVQYPHNIVLEAWAELGVIGFLLVVATLIAGSVYIARIVRNASGRTRLEAAAVAGLWAASIPNALVSGDLPNNYYLWLSLGLAVGIGQRVEFSASGKRLVQKAAGS
jgi:O-antigen ligase